MSRQRYSRRRSSTIASRGSSLTGRFSEAGSPEGAAGLGKTASGKISIVPRMLPEGASGGGPESASGRWAAGIGKLSSATIVLLIAEGDPVCDVLGAEYLTSAVILAAVHNLLSRPAWVQTK